jgi:Adenine-specific methyltransferase EcoRI
LKKNKQLHKAKAQKQDEYYTQISDIEVECLHYKEEFRNKVILCNCDDPEESNFWKYFFNNFQHLGLKKLISTHFDKNHPSYKLETSDGKKVTKTLLKQNGDFRSPECIEILKEADIVITNPPFSLFREYITQLVEYGKKFLIIGNKNAISYQGVFQLIKENKIWLGYSYPSEFTFNGVLTKQVKGLTRWFTNLNVDNRHEDLDLYKKYNSKNYPKYDNYNIIHVSKVKEIPADYTGIMGVPITFLDKHNPDQFQIIGQMATTKITEYNYGYPYINGEKVFARILIKNQKLI